MENESRKLALHAVLRNLCKPLCLGKPTSLGIRGLLTAL